MAAVHAGGLEIAPLSVQEVSRRLDGLIPARTTLPGVPDPCGSCGHIPDDCPDMCCA